MPNSRPQTEQRPLTQEELQLARELLDGYRAARWATRAVMIIAASIAAVALAWTQATSTVRGWFVGG